METCYQRGYEKREEGLRMIENLRGFERKGDERK
jgi:hypothetical protein